MNDEEDENGNEIDQSEVPLNSVPNDESIEQWMNRRVNRVLEDQQRYMQMYDTSTRFLEIITRMASEAEENVDEAALESVSSTSSVSSPTPDSSSPTEEGEGRIVQVEPIISCQLFQPGPSVFNLFRQPIQQVSQCNRPPQRHVQYDTLIPHASGELCPSNPFRHPSRNALAVGIGGQEIMSCITNVNQSNTGEKTNTNSEEQDTKKSTTANDQSTVRAFDCSAANENCITNSTQTTSSGLENETTTLENNVNSNKDKCSPSKDEPENTPVISLQQESNLTETPCAISQAESTQPTLYNNRHDFSHTIHEIARVADTIRQARDIINSIKADHLSSGHVPVWRGGITDSSEPTNDRQSANDSSSKASSSDKSNKGEENRTHNTPSTSFSNGCQSRELSAGDCSSGPSCDSNKKEEIKLRIVAESTDSQSSRTKPSIQLQELKNMRLEVIAEQDEDESNKNECGFGGGDSLSIKSSSEKSQQNVCKREKDAKSTNTKNSTDKQEKDKIKLPQLLVVQPAPECSSVGHGDEVKQTKGTEESSSQTSSPSIKGLMKENKDEKRGVCSQSVRQQSTSNFERARRYPRVYRRLVLRPSQYRNMYSSRLSSLSESPPYYEVAGAHGDDQPRSGSFSRHILQDSIDRSSSSTGDKEKYTKIPKVLVVKSKIRNIVTLEEFQKALTIAMANLQTSYPSSGTFLIARNGALNTQNETNLLREQRLMFNISQGHNIMTETTLDVPLQPIPSGGNFNSHHNNVTEALSPTAIKPSPALAVSNIPIVNEIPPPEEDLRSQESPLKAPPNTPPIGDSASVKNVKVAKQSPSVTLAEGAKVLQELRNSEQIEAPNLLLSPSPLRQRSPRSPRSDGSRESVGAKLRVGGRDPSRESKSVTETTADSVSMQSVSISTSATLLNRGMRFQEGIMESTLQPISEPYDAFGQLIKNPMERVGDEFGHVLTDPSVLCSYKPFLGEDFSDSPFKNYSEDLMLKNTYNAVNKAPVNEDRFGQFMEVPLPEDTYSTLVAKPRTPECLEKSNVTDKETLINVAPKSMKMAKIKRTFTPDYSLVGSLENAETNVEVLNSGVVKSDSEHERLIMQLNKPLDKMSHMLPLSNNEKRRRSTHKSQDSSGKLTSTVSEEIEEAYAGVGGAQRKKLEAWVEQQEEASDSVKQNHLVAEYSKQQEKVVDEPQSQGRISVLTRRVRTIMRGCFGKESPK